MKEKEELKELIKKYSLKVSDEPIYKLVSGKLSRFYVDLKQVTFDPYGINLIGKVVYDFIKEFSIEGVGGLTLGADPIAYSVVFESFKNGRVIYPFVVRKEQKQHGTGKRVETKLQKNAKVLVIEDVLTTGGSSLKAVNACKEEGFNVIGVLTILDREEGGKENLQKEGINLFSIFKLSELL